MCYHVASPSYPELQKRYPKKRTLYKGAEIFHVSGFTRPYLPVTLNTDIDSIVSARWKLAPFWTKSEDALNRGINTLNAKCETIFEVKSYRPYIEKNRGLLYVKGFFEPHSTDGIKNDENRFVYNPNGDIFTLGIVFSNFTNEEGLTYPTFTIVTTPANDFMKDIHNIGERMPLIIPADSRDAWLFAEGRQEIENLMIPYAGDLQAHKVKNVTSMRGIDTNIPEIQLPIS